jgi:phosphate transport system protein
MLLGDNSDISIEGAVDVALLGRYFERFADHAVAVGRRVIYIITGQVPEGEDWPNA